MREAGSGEELSVSGDEHFHKRLALQELYMRCSSNEGV